MKGGTFVLLAAFIAVCYAELQAVQLPAKPEDDDHKVVFNKLDDRLDKLTARLVGLEDKIQSRIDPARVIRAKSLKYRVDKIQGTGCAKRDYQCGGTDPQCVGVLLVCDGIKDCRNGADEKNCDLPFKAGDYFVGHMIFDKCTKRQPDGLDFEITSVRKSSAFNSFIKLSANIVIEYESDTIDGHVAMPTIGYYSFGLTKMVFNPPESDRLYVVCDFDGANFDRCIGHIKRESGEECAKLIFTRKH